MCVVIAPISAMDEKVLAFLIIYIMTEIMKLSLAVELTKSVPTDPITIEHEISKDKGLSFDVDSYDFV